MPPVNTLGSLYTYTNSAMQDHLQEFPVIPAAVAQALAGVCWFCGWQNIGRTRPRSEGWGWEKGEKRPCEPRGENRKRDRRILAARFLWKVAVLWRGAHARAGKQRDQVQQRGQWPSHSPSCAAQWRGKGVRSVRVKLRLKKRRDWGKGEKVLGC